MRGLAETGATHVAIATPYDEESFPISRGGFAARKYHLGCGFGGIFPDGKSGWLPKHISSEHIFENKHLFGDTDIFQDGDVFRRVPECENGGPGDPRSTGDIGWVSEILKDEYAATQAVSRRSGKMLPSISFP